MTSADWHDLLAEAWRAVAGEAPLPAHLSVDHVPRDQLPADVPVADTAIACIGAALLAAVALGKGPEDQAGSSRAASLRGDHLAAAVRSESYLTVGGRAAGPGFAPLSRFWRTADGWARTHANYPWHRRALLGAVGLPDHGTDDTELAERLASVFGELPAAEVERIVVEAGGVAAAMRTPDEWLRHPHGRVVAEQPLIGLTRHEPGRPRPRPAGGPLPAEGVRVLDLTRVIAGPVATRYLAALGADVLRLDPPDRPELTLHRYDGLPGKRSALLDASTRAGRTTLHELLAGADVLVHGYRPGALDRFGLDAETLAERHPGLVVVTLSAWGGRGPWGDRRGFDSIVQAGVGIAARESPGDGRPGALPCQLLDHGTGYLCAAAALDGLRRQAESGGGYLRELSLARTAHWLLGQPSIPAAPGVEPVADGDWLVDLRGDRGRVRTVAPPGAIDGRQLGWPDELIAYGAADARW
ncbi:CoA transferase [Pseudonocardia eucalypti]|uniref:CoA transferase n=1 Tax=Pseudonocardia eucalypti TaxID=648755 RepID=A0ABP9PDT9_9PSEU|nr:crotonobetainyl-CoA:carnitine CoA-transferase CaiB-like acyl-CoA transferase [Pseudonocardia eucalypti]